MNTVLVATERDLEQNLLAQALDGQGYHIIRSRDGIDAMEIARNKTPQVLLVNVALPKLDGFALFRRFQQDEQLRRIPVVLFSTRSNDQKSERFAQELGASRFVANALKPGALDGVIAAALAAEPPPPLPAVELLVRPAPVEAVVDRPTTVEQTESEAEQEMVEVIAEPVVTDRTLKLPALAISPEVIQLQQLQAEQVQLQQTLQFVRQQLGQAQPWQDLFSLSPVAMWIVNAEAQKMLAVNEATLRLFGYSYDEFMQLDSPAMLRDTGQAQSTNVLAYRGKDGRTLSLLVNSRELIFRNQPSELWVAHDVSYRVRGERAIAEEVQRVKAVLAAIPLAYLVIDTEGRVRDSNTACCELLGLTREQLLQHNVSQLINDTQQVAALQALPSGQHLSVAVRYADATVHQLQFSAGQQEFGNGLRLLMLQTLPEPVVVAVKQEAPVNASKLPVVLEMLRYAEDADEATLLQYSLAQLAQAFNSPLALFASVERVTQTLEVLAMNHAQARPQAGGSLPMPAPWQPLLMPRGACTNNEPDEALLVEGLPEISSYVACATAYGRELRVLVIANREDAYTEAEQRELQECAEALIAIVMHKRLQSKLQTTTQRSAKVTEGMLKLLERLLDQHDIYGAGSGQRVASLAANIASQLGLSGEQQAALALAGRLHDLGHLALPQTLLLQPTALNPAERALLQTHVERGVQLLRSVEMGMDVAGIVAQHHERLDGSGYPAALQGTQINMEARILAVADVVEAMTAARAYRPAQGLAAALNELRSGAGRLYDAEVVAACERLFALNEGRWPVWAGN
ncbi:MAG: HD domain-containing phosphohydrolase [Steroidobacteraceae bacterium]